MGNASLCLPQPSVISFSSCSSSPSPSSSRSSTVLLIHGVTGEVLQHTLEEGEARLKVVEVMLDHPGHFVCHGSCASELGRRLEALPADQDLLTGELYFLFPMRRIHSRVSADTVGLLSQHMKRSTLKYSKPHQSKLVSPAESPRAASPALSSTKSFSDRASPPSAMRELASVELSLLLRSRSWKPNLETIIETHGAIAFHSGPRITKLKSRGRLIIPAH